MKERKEECSEGYFSRLSGNRGRKRGPEHMMGGEEPGTGVYNGVGCGEKRPESLVGEEERRQGPACMMGVEGGGGA